MRQDGDFLREPILFECARVEELQSRDSLLECRPGELPLVEQIELILSDLLCAQLVRRLVEVAGEISNGVCISPNRLVGVVPQPQMVFTVPEPLKPLMLQNQQLMYGLLFRAVSQTLLEIAADPRRLGAQIGFLAVLHTWSQTYSTILISTVWSQLGESRRTVLAGSLAALSSFCRRRC